MDHRSDFLFALNNPVSGRALKQEVSIFHTTWKPSYQQRGFATFKTAGRPFTLRSLADAPSLARRLCLSIGRCDTLEAARELCSTAAGAEALIHCVRLERGVIAPTERDPSQPKKGQLVATIVELGPSEFWCGLHQHSAYTSPDLGGDGGLTMPADSPSRAWLKLEEAARFFGLSFSTADIVAELGCAPGGVVLALLRRGVSVIGIDPARLAPVISTWETKTLAPPLPSGPWFYHCRKPAALAGKKDLAVPVTWFMSDMNQSPDVALKECARFRKMCPSLHSALITLKLTDLDQIRERETWIETGREMGFKSIKIQQLSVHHRELVMLARG